MNLFSIVCIYEWCFVGGICIALGIYLKHKANNCTSGCKGILNEICENLSEYRGEDGHKKYFTFPYMSLK